MQSASPPAARRRPPPRRRPRRAVHRFPVAWPHVVWRRAAVRARTIVEERKWLSADEFTDLLGLCQFLPGGNVINLSVAVGMRFRGVAGAFAGILGLIAATLVVVALGVLYAKTQNDPRVQHLFAPPRPGCSSRWP